MLKPGAKSKVFLGLSIFSIIVFIVTIVLAFELFPTILKTEIKNALQLEKDTEQFDRFLKAPFPLEFNIYLFNVSNPDEILNGARPELEEIGPFTYREVYEKEEQFTNEGDDTISYHQYLNFTFDQEASGNLTEDYEVTILNTAYLVLLQEAELYGLSSIVKDCIHLWFPPKYQYLFVKVAVRDLFFDGIEFLLDDSGLLCGSAAFLIRLLAPTKKNLDVTERGTLIFSFFNYKVKSHDGLFTINRGIENIENLGLISKLNNKTHTEYWGGLESDLSCDSVSGRDGSLFPPDLDEDSQFAIYTTDLCRSIKIYATGEATFKGIDGLKFTLRDDALKPSTENPADDCYCSLRTLDENGEQNCYLDGVLDLYPCTNEPVLVSFPHFLGADDHYKQAVDGLDPNKEQHGTFIIIEPGTGAPLVAARRMQLNAVLRPVRDVPETTNLPRLVFPLVWVEEALTITDKYLDDLNDYFSAKSLLAGIQWGLVALFGVLSLIFSAIFIKIQFF